MEVSASPPSHSLRLSLPEKLEENEMGDRIHVSWETISDSLTEQGQGLMDRVVAMIEGGSIVDVEMPNGTLKTFDDEEEFARWYSGVEIESEDGKESGFVGDRLP
jgi:hypothetical protein